MATGRLKGFNARFGVGRTGMILQLLAVIVLIAALAFTASALASLATAPPPVGPALPDLVIAVYTFLIVLVVAFILALAGSIMFGVMLRRLPEAEGVDPGFKTAGLLYIIGTVLTVVPYVNFVAPY